MIELGIIHDRLESSEVEVNDCIIIGLTALSRLFIK